MPANLDKPHRWKSDIAKSVDAFNRWFIETAPSAFREQRAKVTADVEQAMVETNYFTKIDQQVLMTHPGILPTLRPKFRGVSGLNGTQVVFQKGVAGVLGMSGRTHVNAELRT